MASNEDKLISEDKESFFKYVFNFDQDSKDKIFNIIQYAILAIIPIVIYK